MPQNLKVKQNFFSPNLAICSLVKAAMFFFWQLTSNGEEIVVDVRLGVAFREFGSENHV